MAEKKTADKTVTVEGVGASKDAALDRALRDAVRQGACVDINSISTLVAGEEDEEFREQTVSATMGAVTGYRIIEVTKLEERSWKVKIEATVTRKQVSRPEDVQVQDANRRQTAAYRAGSGAPFCAILQIS